MEAKLVEILEKLETLAVQYAPEALELATATVRVNALGLILTGIGLGIGGVLVARLSVGLWRKRAEIEREDSWSVSSVDYELGGVFSAMAAFGLLLAASILLLNIWNWVAIWNPKLALAKQLMGL